MDLVVDPVDLGLLEDLLAMVIVGVVEEEKQTVSGAIGDLGENVRMVGKDERNHLKEMSAMDQRKKVDHVQQVMDLVVDPVDLGLKEDLLAMVIVGAVEQEKQTVSGVIGDLGGNVRMVGKDERNQWKEMSARDQRKKVDHVQQVMDLVVDPVDLGLK